MKINFEGKVDYCTETGHFYHSVDNRGSTKKGQKAGSRHSNGYVKLKINGKQYYAHRLAFYLLHGGWPKEIDHKDRDKTNNRPENLVESDRVLNNHNKPARSGKTGVYKIKYGWCSQVTVNKDKRHLGTFRCETAAEIAYLLAKENLLKGYLEAKV